MKARDMVMDPETEMHIEKFVHGRMTELLSDRVLVKIWQSVGGEAFRRSSVLYGLDSFLNRCKVKGNIAIEIGTRHGLTAIVLARHFDRVITIDIEKSNLLDEVLRCSGIGHKIQPILISGNHEKQAIFDSVKFDFVYMDGNHADDTQLDWMLSNRCGRVLFHEAWPSQKPVWDLVRSLPQDEITFGMLNSALWIEKSKQGEKMK